MGPEVLGPASRPNVVDRSMPAGGTRRARRARERCRQVTAGRGSTPIASGSEIMHAAERILKEVGDQLLALWRKRYEIAARVVRIGGPDDVSALCEIVDSARSEERRVGEELSPPQ